MRPAPCWPRNERVLPVRVVPLWGSVNCPATVPRPTARVLHETMRLLCALPRPAGRKAVMTDTTTYVVAREILIDSTDWQARALQAEALLAESQDREIHTASRLSLYRDLAAGLHRWMSADQRLDFTEAERGR